VFEVASTRSWRKHNREVIVASTEVEQVFAEAAEERSEAMDVARFEHVRQTARRNDAVLERITGAGRRLCAIAQHPPLTVRRTTEVERQQMQEGALARRHAMTGQQKFRIAEDQRWRNRARLQQLLRTVQIGDDHVQQARALNQARLRGHAIPQAP
jgi:hypothetical protein